MSQYAECLIKYAVNLQKMLYFLSLFKKISAHKRLPRRVNNLSALMIERRQFSAVYLFIFLAKNMRIKKMTSLDYNN